MPRNSSNIKVVLRVKKLRLGKGMSVFDIARKMNISPAQVSRLENGHAEPMISTLLLFARALGVTVDETIDMEQTEESIKQREEADRC